MNPFWFGQALLHDVDIWDQRPPFIPIMKRWSDVRNILWGRRYQFRNHLYDPQPVWNTLCYTFHHMRCAIYVLVVDGRLAAFIPFCNMHYENNWPPVRTTFKNINALRNAHAHTFNRRLENIIPPKFWWANGGLVCNVMPRDGWGQAQLAELYHMIQHTARGTQEFILNKRDHPLLRKDLREPYRRIWGGNPPLITDPENIWIKFAMAGPPDAQRPPTDFTPDFCTIRSFYTSPEFADKAIPTTQDWKLAHKRVKRGVHYRDKRPLALFWGSATGYDVDESNPRLKCALLAAKHPDMVQANLTSWNSRHKFTRDGWVTFVNPQRFTSISVGKKNFITPREQQQFKYIIYLDGQVGASRLGAMLLSGSVILLRRSRAPQPWLWDKLVDWVHVVPIKEDLSDLLEKIQWCRDNDAKCSTMALHAMTLGQTYINTSRLTI